MKALIFLAIVLGACTTEAYLDLIPARGVTPTIGVGLEAVFDVAVNTCGPDDVHPVDCEMSWPTIANVVSDGAVDITSFHGHRLRATDRGAGVGAIRVSTDDGIEGTYDVEVLPVEHSVVMWMDRYWRFGPFNDESSVDSIGPAFAGTTIELAQDHYREPLDVLAQWPNSHRDEYILDGNAPFVIDRGATNASLAPMPDWDEDSSVMRFPRVVLETGAVRGRAVVSTSAGGELAVDVVDQSAIASLGSWEGEPLHEYSWDLHELPISPRDASGRRIAGCPENGPTVSDAKGLITASRVVTEREPYCVLRLDVARDRPLEATTIIVSWNGAELRVPFEP